MDLPTYRETEENTLRQFTTQTTSIKQRNDETIESLNHEIFLIQNTLTNHTFLIEHTVQDDLV